MARKSFRWSAMLLARVGKGDYFAVGKLRLVDGQPYDGALAMPSLQSGCTGIDVQQPKLAVVFDFENMGMSADEQLGRTFH